MLDIDIGGGKALLLERCHVLASILFCFGLGGSDFEAVVFVEKTFCQNDIASVSARSVVVPGVVISSNYRA